MIKNNKLELRMTNRLRIASRPVTAFVFALIAAAVALVAGCGHDNTETDNPPASPGITVPQTSSNKSVGEVTIYRLAQTEAEQKVADENGLIPVTVKIPVDAQSPAKEAIEYLITADGSPIPAGTKLRGVKIDDTSGLATVDFSKEFKDNFAGGDKLEAQIINSVRATFGQFSNVQNVQFLVAGQKIAQLGGTQELDEPLPVIRVTTSEADASKDGGQ